MSTRVWDIVQPKDNWERNYAKMEYKRIMWHDLWNPVTYIEVKDDSLFICSDCGAINNYWIHLCGACDLKSDHEIDEAIQNG